MVNVYTFALQTKTNTMKNSTKIKREIATVLGVAIKYVAVKKNKGYFNGGLTNDFFVDAQNDSTINRDWNHMNTHADYCALKIEQAAHLETRLGMLVEPTANKANFNFYTAGV